jgi:Protein of unknown function (DUF2867)
MHIGAVEDEDRCFSAQMAVLVKTNGRFGDAYMAAIKPFRHLIVYPSRDAAGSRSLGELLDSSCLRETLDQL